MLTSACFLGFLHEVKKNALSGDNECPCVCDLSARKPIVGFSLNSVKEFFTNSCLLGMSFMKIDVVTVILYVRA